MVLLERRQAYFDDEVGALGVAVGKTEDLIKDLTVLLGALDDARSRVKSRIGDIREKVRVRRHKGRSVSDHAIVRYLERTERLDADAVRDEIRALVEQSEKFTDVDGVFHSETGLVFIVDAGSVITVLSREQSEKYLGKELVGGGVAQRLEVYNKPTPTAPAAISSVSRVLSSRSALDDS